MVLEKYHLQIKCTFDEYKEILIRIDLLLSALFSRTSELMFRSNKFWGAGLNMCHLLQWHMAFTGSWGQASYN